MDQDTLKRRKGGLGLSIGALAVALALTGCGPLEPDGTLPDEPGSCSYTYSAWGDCQADGTQTRTITASSPTGCTGAPVVSQSCTPSPDACYYAYSAWGDCQADGTQARTVVTASPGGCTGAPVLSQVCTPSPAECSYTYSAWGACQSDGTQIRTVTASAPAGCTGTPVLSQSCTYTPPACSYTYSAWGQCQSDGTQTRTVTGSSPSGCSGTAVLSQGCTYTPPTPTCGSCHAIPPSTGKHSKHVTSFGISCDTCHGSGYGKTTVNSSLHQDGNKDVESSTGWNGTSCSNGCHGSKSW